MAKGKPRHETVPRTCNPCQWFASQHNTVSFLAQQASSVWIAKSILFELQSLQVQFWQLAEDCFLPFNGYHSLKTRKEERPHLLGSSGICSRLLCCFYLLLHLLYIPARRKAQNKHWIKFTINSSMAVDLIWLRAICMPAGRVKASITVSVCSWIVSPCADGRSLLLDFGRLVLVLEPKRLTAQRKQSLKAMCRLQLLAQPIFNGLYRNSKHVCMVCLGGRRLTPQLPAQTGDQIRKIQQHYTSFKSFISSIALYGFSLPSCLLLCSLWHVQNVRQEAPRDIYDHLRVALETCISNVSATAVCHRQGSLPVCVLIVVCPSIQELVN